MAARLILNELDVDLTTLSAGFVVVVVVVVGCGADARTLDATVVGAIGIVGVIGARRLWCVGVGDVCHDVQSQSERFESSRGTS